MVFAHVQQMTAVDLTHTFMRTRNTAAQRARQQGVSKIGRFRPWRNVQLATPARHGVALHIGGKRVPFTKTTNSLGKGGVDASQGLRPAWVDPS